jgi:hypothetical protein
MSEAEKPPLTHAEWETFIAEAGQRLTASWQAGKLRHSSTPASFDNFYEASLQVQTNVLRAMAEAALNFGPAQDRGEA